MRHLPDPVAYKQAMKEWVVPECLHIPIVAVDEAAICDHVGDIIEVLSPGRALLVQTDEPPPRDLRLPIWDHPNVDVLHARLQVWVKPDYTRYRPAYIRAMGKDQLGDKVLHHVFNRHNAVLHGYGFVRLAAISRQVNSSGSFTEQWGIKMVTEPEGREILAKRKARGFRVQYASLEEILVMLDVRLGGGIQEVCRIGQNLIEVPGSRASQTYPDAWLLPDGMHRGTR